MEAPGLVASDVDGTLIGADERVTERTRAAVRAVIDAGVPFVLCTGRPPRWIHPIADQLGYAPLAVCANGAVLYDSAHDRVLSARTLDPDTLAWIAEVTERVLPGRGLAAERIGASAHDAVTPQFVTAPAYEHAWLNPVHTEVSALEVVGEPAIKLLARLPGASSTEMRRLLLPEIGARADITFSTDNGLIEFAAPGITKGTGLATIAERDGVAASATIAFGDMPNDIPMLSWAGHGVAMGNAHPEAKQIADEVTGSNAEDGVALILERWWKPSV